MLHGMRIPASAISFAQPSAHTIPVDAHLEAIEPSGLRVVPVDAASDRFGVAFLVPFFEGAANCVSVVIEPPVGSVIRIEAVGFVARMQKAYVELDASGVPQVVGEEVRDLRCDAQDGRVEVSFAFTAQTSRSDCFYVFCLLPPEADEADAPRRLDVLNFEFECRVIEGHPRLTPEPLGRSDVHFRVGALYVFQNYIHLDFELHRLGTRLRWLALASSVSVAAARWWTTASLGKNERPDDLPEGVYLLTSRRAPIGVPSPRLMERVGTGLGSSGHRLAILLDEMQDGRLVGETQICDALKGLRLMGAFEDGKAFDLPIDPVAHSSLLSSGFGTGLEMGHVDRYRAELGATRRPSFLEVGARGPSSTAMRGTVEAHSNYIGVDAFAGPNVDVVGDAHRLSELIEPASIDIVYSHSVVEHLVSPRRFLYEANRVLRRGGLFVAFAPVSWALHAEPWDFWRISPHAWRAMFHAASGFELVSLREIGDASIVPSLTAGVECARMQFAAAPLFTGLVARKVRDAELDRALDSADRAAGRYDP